MTRKEFEKQFKEYATGRNNVRDFVSTYNNYSQSINNVQSALQGSKDASRYIAEANNAAKTLNSLITTSAVKDYLGKDYDKFVKSINSNNANLTYFDLANKTSNYSNKLKAYAENYTKDNTYQDLDSTNTKLSEEINQAVKKYADNKDISSALSGLLESLKSGKEIATQRNDLYSQFDSVEDYDKAKRSYDLERKYGKMYEPYDTPEKLEAYLREQAKETTLIPGKQGLTYDGIDPDEAEYVKNKMNQVKFTKYNGMSIKELETALEDLENKKSNAKKEWLNAGKKSKEVGYTTDEQKQARHRWESIITQTDYIKTIIAQKEQEEYFNNQWGFRYKQFAGAPLVVNNDEGDYNGAKEDKIMALIRTSPTNDDQYQRDIMQTSQVTGSDPDTYARVQEMTDEEKTVFANIYRKDKKEALKYFEALNKTYLDSRLSTTIQTRYSNWAKQNGWTVAASAALSPLYTVAGAFEAPISLATGNRSIAAAKKQGMQSGAKSTWANSQNADFYNFLYDAGTSILDSGIAIGTTALGFPSWVGTGILGADLASATYNNLLDSGADRAHATIGAILAGAAEAFFESFSIERLRAFSPSSLNTAKKLAGKRGLIKTLATNLAKQTLTEGSEEIATEIADIIINSIYQSDLSDINTSFVYYINQGMSEKEAKKQVAKDLANQVFVSGAAGALSGFTLGLGGAVVSSISSNVSASKVGATVKQNLDGFKQLAETADISDNAKETIASLTNKSSNINVGFAAQQAFLQMSENSVNQISAELQKSGMDVKTANRNAQEIVSSTLGTSTESRYVALNLFANPTVAPILQNFVNGQYGGDTLKNLYNMAFSGNLVQDENITAETEKAENTPQIQSEAGVVEGEAVTPTENITALTKGGSKFTADRVNIDTATANENLDVKELVERKQAALGQKKATNPNLQGVQLHFVDENTRSVLESIADRLGVDLEFTNDMADGKYSNGKISISVVGERPIALTFAHELIHYLQSGKGYTRLESYIFQEDAQGDAENTTFRDWLVKNGFANLDEAFDTYAENYADVYDTTADNFDSLVRQEIVADFIADTLLTDYGDENIDTDFMAQLRKDDRSLFQKIIDFFKKLFTASKGTQFEQDVKAIYDRLNGLLESISEYDKNATDTKKRYSIGNIEYIELAQNPKENNAELREMVQNAAKEWGAIEENGKPKVFYHGTDADFTVFDSTKGRSTMDIQGMFFSPWEIDAQGYGKNVGEYYLNIQNPAPERVAYKALNMFTGQNYAGIKARDYLISLGYDGVNNSDEEYIAFFPEQIKSADPVTYDDNGNVIPLSERFNQTNPDIRYSKGELDIPKAVADGDMTVEEGMEEAIKRYGAIEKGATPRVDVAVPKKVSDAKSTRAFVRTVLESGSLDSDMSESVKAEIVKDTLSHEIITDESSLRKASKVLESMDGDANEMMEHWHSIIKSDNMTKADVVYGELLLKTLAESGDTSAMLEVLTDLSVESTRYAQNLQALSILKKLGGYGQLLYIQKSVDRMNQDLTKRYKGKKPLIKIKPTYAQMILDAAESKKKEKIDAAVSAMTKDIADQTPSSFIDKWNAWRYMSMLANLGTHIRNIGGNSIFFPAVMIKDQIGALAEKTLPAENRTKILGIASKEYRDFASKDSKVMQDILQAGGKYNPETDIDQRRKVFKAKWLKWLEWLRKTNFDLLEKEDWIFLRAHYITAMSGFLQARKINLNNITEKQLQEARHYAVQEALKATYRDASAVATALSKFSKTNKVASVFVEGLIPFKKTPINILKRGVEYSPVGIIKALAKGGKSLYDNAVVEKQLKDGKITAKEADDIRSTKMTASEFIDSLASGLTGTGILLLGVFLRSLGIVTGGKDKDDDDSLLRALTGEQNFALRFGDNTYTIDWAMPVSMPFLVGSALYDLFQRDGANDILTNLTAGLNTSLDPFIELSMLQGIRDAIEMSTYSDIGVIDLPIQVMTSYLSQAFPTVGGQVARTIDATKRSNYVASNTPFKSVAYALEKIKGKIPIVENTKVPRINVWGETETDSDDAINILKRLAENFISPGYTGKIDNNKLNEEIAKVYKDTGEKGVIPQKADKSFKVNRESKNLNADEYVIYAVNLGGYRKEMISEAISNPLWRQMPSDSKAKAIKNILEYANAKAKATVSDYDVDKEYSNIYNKEKKYKISPAEYYVAMAYAGQESNDTNNDGTVTQKEKQRALAKNKAYSGSKANQIVKSEKKQNKSK